MAAGAQVATPAIPQACAGVAHPTEPARCAYRAANRGCELQGCTIVEGKCALYLRPLATRQALEYSNFAIPALSNVFDTRDRGIAHGSRVCCSILACTMAHHTSCTSSAHAPANVIVGFSFVALCGTMLISVLGHAVAVPYLQIPSRWGGGAALLRPARVRQRRHHEQDGPHISLNG